jgi:hypothetical protein
MTTNKFCPICNCGNIDSHRIRVCNDCQSQLLPEGEDYDKFEDELVFPSVDEAGGFLHQ